ncbi:hypothetical protein MMC18_008503 [Xylographa bjoerkii]|nr:hypothetical protein [Xylographa bjoerkii]
MSSIFKGSFGKKPNAASDMPPPSYATRPPKNHRKASSIIDSEEDEEIMQPSRADIDRTKQVYDIDSDDEEVLAQPSHPPPHTRSHGGRNNVDHERADNHSKHSTRLDSGRRGTSQALVRRDPSPFDEEPGPSRGRRGGNKSNKVSRSRSNGKRQASSDEETVTVERFRAVKMHELSPKEVAFITDCFEIPTRKLRDYCDDGKIRFDRKSDFFDFELMYPLFPPHVVNRFEDELKKLKKSKNMETTDEIDRGGRTIAETRFLVPTYVPYEPYLEPYYEPYYKPNYEPYYNPYTLNTGRHHPGLSSHDPTNPLCCCMDCEL